MKAPLIQPGFSLPKKSDSKLSANGVWNDESVFGEEIRKELPIERMDIVIQSL